ncbi:MAG TPA: hypothetical protein PKC19_07610 [Roseiflexaceae bacterium]|nr:hypothetical protein [Roseiflexaceae bacterium]
MKTRISGQALVLFALIMPVLLGLLLVGIELASRNTSTREVRDAIRAANRSAVQTFDYAAFAENQLALADTNAVVVVARRLAAINLRGIAGLTLPPEMIADRVTWTALSSDGACLLEPDGPTLHFATPVLCASAEVELVSPLGFTWTTRIFAADTLDLSFSSAE